MVIYSMVRQRVGNPYPQGTVSKNVYYNETHSHTMEEPNKSKRSLKKVYEYIVGLTMLYVRRMRKHFQTSRKPR